mmetsp:Transcript_49181/g.81663  ORF Transcript_49181/g.81663 Transcript_49181/m.81663 type:complete len:229 (-) Transcript_49181:844-1530(-)
MEMGQICLLAAHNDGIFCEQTRGTTTIRIDTLPRLYSKTTRKKILGRSTADPRRAYTLLLTPPSQSVVHRRQSWVFSSETFDAVISIDPSAASTSTLVAAGTGSSPTGTAAATRGSSSAGFDCDPSGLPNAPLNPSRAPGSSGSFNSGSAGSFNSASSGTFNSGSLTSRGICRLGNSNDGASGGGAGISGGAGGGGAGGGADIGGGVGGMTSSSFCWRKLATFSSKAS